jgi:4-diphosphocytidyl-2-C-methyl-D-erythritol kinase
MLNEYVERAYAKVNFNLKVLPKRSDGFHNIESIFQTVDLFDELNVTTSENDCCNVVCEKLNLPVQNTLTMAYQAFRECTACDVPGIRVVLKKGIPAGGGLGGGSSDAAALIRVLEKMCGLKLSESQLDYIAGKTGSDVFFFMHCGPDGKGAALVSGRGEHVKRIESRQDLLLLLVFPAVASSTKEAYSLVDEDIQKGYKVKCPDFKDLASIYADEPKNWGFKNSFTPSLCSKYKEIDRALEQLKKTGADYVEMSGSGSTVFGVFTLRQQAIYSSNLLADSWNCVLAQTV